MDALSLLGRDVGDPEVEKFFEEHLGSNPDWSELDAENYYSDEITIPSLGLEVSAFNKDRFVSEDRISWIIGTGMIGALHFSKKSAATSAPPFSVTWEETLPSVHQKLKSQAADSCVFDNLIAVRQSDRYTTFVFKDQVLDEVRIELKPVLLAPTEDIQVPEFSELNAALGVRLDG